MGTANWRALRTPFTHDCFESSGALRTRTAIPTPFVLAFLLALAGCAQPERTPEPPPPPVEAPIPDPTPLRFNVRVALTTPYAFGQILGTSTPAVSYDARAQLLGLNAIRYRGEALMLLTRALPMSDTIKALTTEVTVATAQGKAMHSEGAAELLALLARELPTEIESVKAGLAAQEKAKETPKARGKRRLLRSAAHRWSRHRLDARVGRCPAVRASFA